MENQNFKMSDYEIGTIIIFYISGTATLLVRGVAAGKDAWIACIIAIFMVVIMGYIYVSINGLYPGNNLYEVMVLILGKWIGKAMVLFFVSYTFLTIVLVIRDIGEFIRVAILNSTPVEFLMYTLVLLSIFVLKKGLQVLGAWCKLFILPLTFVFILVIFSLISKMELINIMPLLNQPMKNVFRGAISVYVFPLGETVIFMTILTCGKDKMKSYKRYIKPVIIGGLLIGVTSIINILVMGIDIISASYFPTLSVLKISDLGTFFKRIEILIALAFIMGTFVKVTVYLYGLCKGIEVLFDLKSYKLIVLPAGTLAVQISTIMFINTTDFFEWNDTIWVHIGVLFQIFIPLFLIVVGLIKLKVTEIRTKI